MIGLIISSALFDILGPPPGYNQDPPAVESVEEATTEKKVIKKKSKKVVKEEPVSNNEPKEEPVAEPTLKEDVKEEEKPEVQDNFSEVVGGIIQKILDEPIVVNTPDAITEAPYREGHACSKAEDTDDLADAGVEPVAITEEEPVEDSLHYYVYTGVNCRYCVLLLAELESNVDAESISVVKNARKTKSGKVIQYYPVLEVYKGEECIYHGVGYKKWSDLTKVINK